MRSNIPTRQSVKKDLHAIAKEEIERQKKEFCPACQEQMQNQTIAVLLYSLNKSEGFGKKRLKRIFESVCAMGEYIHSTGNWYEEVVKWLRDDMGIDLERGD